MFYKNTATPIHLHTVMAVFTLQVQSWVVLTESVCLLNLKYLLPDASWIKFTNS